MQQYFLGDPDRTVLTAFINDGMNGSDYWNITLICFIKQNNWKLTMALAIDARAIVNFLGFKGCHCLYCVIVPQIFLKKEL